MKYLNKLLKWKPRLVIKGEPMEVVDELLLPAGKKYRNGVENFYVKRSKGVKRPKVLVVERKK